MTRRKGGMRAGIILFALTLIPVSTSAQGATSVQGALLSTATEGPDLIIRITNSSQKPVEVWDYEIVMALSSGEEKKFTMTVDTYTLEALSARPGRGPILPGSSRVEKTSIPAGFTRIVSARLRFVMFTDLTWEGDKGTRDEVLLMREGDADEYDYWLPILQSALTRQPAATKAEIVAAEKERKNSLRPRGLTETRAGAIRANLLQLLDRDDSTLMARVANYRLEMLELRRLALRHLAKVPLMLGEGGDRHVA